MSLNQALHLVLYEGMGAQPLRSEARLATMSTLLERGYGVTCTSSDISVDPLAHTVVMVLGQFAPNTAPSSQRAGASVTIRFQEISGLDGSQIAARVEAFRTETSSPKHGEWKPWFPVID